MKKIGLLILVLVLALGAVGVGYAHWTDSLFIKGTIATGNIDPLFACACSNDAYLANSDDPADWSGPWDYAACDWKGLRRDKDVGSTDAAISTDKTELTISAHNTYPCYYGSVAYSVYNPGSVPVMVKGFELIRVSGHTVGRYKNVSVNLTPCVWYFVDVDKWVIDDEPGKVPGADFSIHISEGQADRQIDPWDWGPDVWYGDIDIHTEQPSHQLAKYDFTIKLLFENWPTNP